MVKEMMQLIARGVIAALLFSLIGASRAAASAPPIALAPGATTLSDGLTVQVRPYHASPVVVIEAWFGVPSDGYGPSKPGIARLAALALGLETFGGKNLRDLAHDAGGQLAVTVYPAATEIAVLVPSYAAKNTIRTVMKRVFHPTISQNSFSEARKRLAAQQAALQGAPEVTLRDAVFSALFSSGPYHLPPSGTPAALTGITIDDVRAFARKAFVTGNGILVISGDVDSSSILPTVWAQAPLPGQAVAAPPSALSPKPQTVVVASPQANESGIAVAWAGPPIADEQAATALDFLSDYLMRRDYGVVAQQIKAKYPKASVSGEFVTLRDPGVLYFTVSGPDVEPTAMTGLVRDAIKRAISSPLGAADFAHAIDVYRVHALRDNVGTAEILADNYGWYFVHGAPAYAPSATDENVRGDYFAQVSALTPQIVYGVARRYLNTEPATAVLQSHQPSAAQAPVHQPRPMRGGK